MGDETFDLPSQGITRRPIREGEPPRVGFRAHWTETCWCGYAHDPQTGEVAQGAEVVPRSACFDDHTYLMLNGLHSAYRCDCF
jgi:hypothetical protein